MRIRIDDLSEDWDYYSSEEEEIEKLPNRKFKTNYIEGEYRDLRSAGKSSKRSRKRRDKYARQHYKSYKY